MKEFPCAFCGRPLSAFCKHCSDSWGERPDPKAMTADEREAEMQTMAGPMSVPFTLIHERIEALVGRGVYTHEIGLNWDGLCSEARWETPPPSLSDVIDLIPADKQVIVAVVGRD